MRRLRARKASHPIGAWPRQPACFEPPPTSGSLQLLSESPMGRNRLDAETQSHLIFFVCRRRLPMATCSHNPGWGPSGLVGLDRMWSSGRKIDPVVTVGTRLRAGGLDWERKVRRAWCIPSAERPRHLCLISDERVQVRCRRKHRTFRLGKPVAAAVEARVALSPGYPGLSRSVVRPARLAGRSRQSLAGHRDRDLCRGYRVVTDLVPVS